MATGAAAPATEAVRAADAKAREFPCAQCGATLAFAPGMNSLACSHCGHTQAIPEQLGDIVELDYHRFFGAGAVAEEVLLGAAGETRCPGCGAMLTLSSGVAKDLCGYCGSQLTNALEAPRPQMAVGALLPFAIAADDARLAFDKWVRSLWFAPNELKRFANLNRPQGLYTPYWSYDADTTTTYTGQRGEHYYVTVGSGNNRRRERRTRWYPAAGTVDVAFDDVLVLASKSVPAELSAKLEPWDTASAVPYAPEYLSGFRAERYQVSAQDGMESAKETMAGRIHTAIRADIGGDDQRVHSTNTLYRDVKFKLMLLPVYLSTYQWKGRCFRVLVNARTGEVSGERPYSAWKIAGLVLAIVVLFVLMALFAEGRSAR